MTELARPDLRFHASWAAAVREFEADGSTMHGGGLWDLDTADLGPEALAPEIERLLAEADPATKLREKWVHCTYFWIVEGDEFLGYLAIRHALNDFLYEQGGHIGYSVRPSRRREGHAGRALALALQESRRLGIDRVLVTCDHDNVPSRLTIERAGGVFEDQRGVKQRYWFDLTG
ncbi:MAG: GNAT family N-acetyltransferase [Nocardioides sp.]